jgi:hypothetical protein
VSYPQAFHIFILEAFKFSLKATACLVVIFTGQDRSVWVSAVLIGLCVFAIEWFGPRGRQKRAALDFGKMLYRTLIAK